MTTKRMTTQPTPGPWTVAASSYQRLPYSVEGNGWTVARIVWDEHFDNPDEEPLANARLIAAAPRMLEALATLTTVIDRGSDGRLDEFDRDLTAALDAARAILRDLHGEGQG